MDTFYPIYQGEVQVGKAEVLRQGLYYRVVANARLPASPIFRLWAEYPGGNRMLGVLAPENGGYTLRTRIPVKELPGEELRFSAAAPQEEKGEPLQDEIQAQEQPAPAENTSPPPGRRYVPIAPDEPFAYIAKLKDAFLLSDGAHLQVSIPEDGTDRESPAEG